MLSKSGGKHSTHICVFVCRSVCELVYKPKARVELTASRSIRIVCKVARPVDLKFEVKFLIKKQINIKTDCGVMSSYENTSKIKISASQLISNMICMNYGNNKKFGLLQFHLGYGKFYLNSRKIINAQTGVDVSCYRCLEQRAVK